MLITFAIILIFILSVPLGSAAIVYFTFTSLIRSRILIDSIVLCGFLIFGYLKLDFATMIKQISFIYHSYVLYGPYATIDYQVNHLAEIYTHGLFIILLIPVTLRMVIDWRNSREVERLLAREMANYMKDNSNLVTDGVMLGKSNQMSTPLVITDKELNQHVLIIGTTGSGKTTTLLNFVDSAAKRNLPLIFLDGKGSIDLIAKMADISKHYDRIFKVFTLRPRPDITNLAGYNPFASGSATEWKNRIMSLFATVTGRGQEHFALREQNYINFVANVLAKLDMQVDLRVILAFLENPEKLLAIAHEIEPEIGKKIAKLHNDSEVSQLIGDVVKLLELFIYSDYGHLFNTIGMENVITLRQSILNKEIVLFQFDASAYPEDSRKVAKMVINDINSSFASFNQFTPCFCIFDEFASYASENLAETISLHRSNGIHAIIGSQSITTVKLKAPDTKRIAEELIACCNTYISHTINHYLDAEIMAKIMGTHKSYDVTTKIDGSNNNFKFGNGNNSISHVKLVDNYKIHPQNIIDLKIGEAIIYRKAVGINPIKTMIKEVQYEKN